MAWGGMLSPIRKHMAIFAGGREQQQQHYGIQERASRSNVHAYDKMFDVQERIRCHPRNRRNLGERLSVRAAVGRSLHPHGSTGISSELRQVICRAQATTTALTRCGGSIPTRMRKLQKALRDPSVKLEVGPTEDHYWDEYGKTHPFSQQ